VTGAIRSAERLLHLSAIAIEVADPAGADTAGCLAAYAAEIDDRFAEELTRPSWRPSSSIAPAATPRFPLMPRSSRQTCGSRKAWPGTARSLKISNGGGYRRV
jgi:hypothetical protein